MRIVLVSDAFPPLRSSGAVQLRDLCRAFVAQGHSVTVLLPTAEQTDPWRVHESDAVTVVRLRTPRTRDIGYARRTLAELSMPWLMLWNLRRSPLADTRWDGVVWYSPSIFHGPLVSALKRSSCCRSYLIIRDIFPEWAVDVGLMGRGMVYRFFDAVARYQYSVADVIGVQTPGNRPYFDAWVRRSGRQLEVLPNWLGGASEARCSIRVSETRLSGRKIFVYAGNMGVAQGVGVVLALADRMRNRRDVGFLFVGRGSEAERLKSEAASIGSENVLFFDEIDPDEIPDLYAQCSAGLVVLDPRHRSHNIPGKFLTYMQGGLPVLALVNPGNDISSMIRDERVGQVSEGRDTDEICALAGTLLEQIKSDAGLPDRCRALFVREFSVESAAAQVAAGLRR